MHKRPVFKVAAALLLCVLLAVHPLAFTVEDNTIYVAAVNTNLSINADESISFSSEDAPRFSLQEMAQDGIVDVDENGWLQLEPHLPEAEPDYSAPLRNADDAAEQPRFDFAAQQPAGDYVAGESTRTVVCSTRIYSGSGSGRYQTGGYYETKSFQCVYIGEHCTVWCCTTDNETIRMNAEKAPIIAEQFDNQYGLMHDAFSDSGYDADGDGKIALLCYDIDNEYKTNPNFYGNYYAGYFWMQDLIRKETVSNGDIYTIGDVRFGVAEGQEIVHNDIDCLHIDTFPGMGDSLNNLSLSYSTLTHEYQHMLCYCSRLQGATYLDGIETFLDEGFSMAAQHMVFGYSSVANRVTYMNSTQYTPGNSLTCWGNSMPNYANSYLFGQYIRTRYAQLGYPDSTVRITRKNDNNQYETYDYAGGSIYKHILQEHQRTSKTGMEILSDTFGISQKQLVCDFWVAAALKHSTGIYGFGGEDWATPLNVRLSTSAGTIHNGGARFYKLSSLPALEPSGDLTLVYFTKDGPLPLVTASVSGEKLNVSIGAMTDCKVYVAFYEPKTMRLLQVKSYAKPAGLDTIPINVKSLGYSKCAIKVFLTDTASVPLCAPATAQWPYTAPPGPNELPEIDL